MKKSTITCDMEGRILTMNDGAEEIFGYPKDELIGKKRVSLFSPGEIVLQNVEGWLNEAVKAGEYVGKTNFVKKNGEKFNAKIRITPTFANGKDNPQTGYCGVTEVIDEAVKEPLNFSTKLINFCIEPGNTVEERIIRWYSFELFIKLTDIVYQKINDITRTPPPATDRIEEVN